MANLPKSRIARQIAHINSIVIGGGAVKLPYDITAIDLKFKYRNSGGHMGARKFWQESLPQVHFYNPNIPISVVRYNPPVELCKGTEEEPARLTIKFADGSVKDLDVKNKHSSEILSEFIKTCNATPIPKDEILRVPAPAV